MFKKSLIGAVAVVLTFGACLPAAIADTLDQIKSRGRILVAIDLGHPPFGLLDDKAQQAGSDVDTAKLLAKDLGVELEVVPVSGANRVPFLLSSKVDLVIASFSITEERKKIVDYSKPYGVIPVVVSAPSSVAIASAKDLGGQQIAVARGTTADIELTRVVKEGASDAQVVRYEDEATTNTAVATGQQNVFASALSTAQSIAKQNPGLDMQVKFEMAAYPMGIGLRKNDDALRSWVDEWVSTNLKNGKLNDIYQKYFGQSLPAEYLQ